MKIFEYSQFLLEKKVYQLLLEAEIQYMDEFTEIMKKINHPIAKDMIELIGKDLDVSTNLLGLGEKPDTVTFYNQNQINEDEDWEIIDRGQSYLSFDGLFKKAGYEFKSLENLPNGTKGEVLKFWDVENSDGIIKSMIYNDRIAEFKSSDGKILFIGDKGIKKSLITKGKPQETRIGRLSQRILSKVDKKYSPQEVEEFVNKFKSKVEISRNKHLLFELVKGDDIAYWYLEDRYSSGSGPLQGSCMRYSGCQSYFDIYTQNEDKVSLLILKDEDNSEKISGRAIVWKLDDGKTFMDRIYYTKEEEVELFKSYAREKGWLYKSKQNMTPNEEIESEEGVSSKIQLKVSLEVDFEYFPYMDTMRYLYYHKPGFLSNQYPHEIELSDGTKKKLSPSETLDSTEGGCDYCGGSGETECPDCDGSGELECYDCSGYGQVSCDDCSSTGQIECNECEGSGEVEEDGEMVTCSDCDGDGEVECSHCSGTGEVDCDECGGSGEIECAYCDGHGERDCPECQ